jgi:hypothetical protein
MSKYKICKFVNGNNEEWYQIRKKGLLFWSWISSYEYAGAGLTTRYINKFFTIEQAKEYIKRDIEYTKKGQIKTVECFDYE